MLAAMPPPSSTPPNQGEPRIEDPLGAVVREARTPDRDATGEPGRPAPVVRDRGDACPGALRLHTADDGRLARLRLPGGMLTNHQLDALATAAERYGDGHLGITSRGNAELRGLGDSCGTGLAELLRGAGLLPSERHERVRNIIASPLAGLDGLGHGDLRPWLCELDALLCGRDWTAALSGRFLFALDDGRGDVAGLGADVTLLAQPGGDTAVVRVGASALRVAGADACRAALAAAHAFLATASAAGNGAWRVRELPPGCAVDLATALEHAGISASPATADVPPGPATANTQAVSTPADIPDPATANAPAGSATADLPTGPATANVPAGPATTDLPTVPATADIPAASAAPGIVASPDGTYTLVVVPVLGRVGARRLRALAGPAGEIRVTPWRGFVVPGFGERAARERLRELGDAGFITAPGSPWTGVGACTGRPGCAKALADVRRDALPGPGALPVYWSGCERRCGHPQGDWVDVTATADGHYTVAVRGAAAREVPVPESELAEAVARARNGRT
ncbi:cobalamin biosynthesis protein CobG [Streptomyces sp. NBC_01431]|uniref:cobalamin biosynthesis protein CobG n=1 Tax=Streptomyces sp. NBC_01431 TaxID=2903863 RepID=UPI002E3045D2|nr:cobalamin biosynthesis protein CobG [Streptomyces sp. NBC_01431]